MGFMDQVKAAANDLKDSVEGSLATGNSARDVERHYRDLGMLTYLQDTGRTIDAADRERIVAALRAAETAGAMTAFTLQTGAPPPPPPPTGQAPPYAGQQPPPAGQAPPYAGQQPPPAGQAPPPPPPPAPQSGEVPPPPPSAPQA